MRQRFRSRTYVIQGLLAAMIILFLPGCSTAPEEDWYAIANGADTDVGKVEVRSLLLVANEKDERGRLLGTLFNNSDAPAEVTISDADDRVTIRVKSRSNLGLDTNPHFFSSVSEIPGSRVPVTITVGTESTKLDIPVLGGNLPAYRPYLPTGSPSP